MDKKEWYELRQDEAYKLSMAEFKGATLQALKEMRNDVNENRQGIQNVENKVNNLRVISGTIGAIGGIVTTLLAMFFQQTR